MTKKEQLVGIKLFKLSCDARSAYRKYESIMEKIAKIDPLKEYSIRTELTYSRVK